MEMHEILEELNGIFKRTFDDYDIILRDETTANDIKDWDSLSHVKMITEVEKHFQITFSTPEIMRWKNVGMMCSSIQKRLNQE